MKDPNQIDALVDAIIERGSPTLDRIIAERDKLRAELAAAEKREYNAATRAEAAEAENERLKQEREQILDVLENLKEAVDIVASEQCEEGEHVEWWNRRTGAGWQAATAADALLRANGRS